MASCNCTSGGSDPRCCQARAASVQADSDLSAELAKEFNNLRGRILGLIESWGLPEVQERGCKSTFKSLTYDAQARLADLLGD